jgi:hypothetical protein
MKTQLTTSGRYTIGVDLGDKRSHLCVLDAEGQIASECIITTSPVAFRKHFLVIPSALVVLEVGSHSQWASDLLTGLGHEVLVAHAGRVSLIHQSDRKNDRLDARHLAKLARVDPSLLSPITHRDGRAQAHLSVIRARDVLVRTRTALINCVRGLIKPTGLPLPSSASAYFARKVSGLIPEILLAAVTPLLEQLDSLSDAILQYDEQIAEIARTERPATPLARSCFGPRSRARNRTCPFTLQPSCPPRTPARGLGQRRLAVRGGLDAFLHNGGGQTDASGAAVAPVGLPELSGSGNSQRKRNIRGGARNAVTGFRFPLCLGHGFHGKE